MATIAEDRWADRNQARKIRNDATALHADVVGYFQSAKLQINELIIVPLIIFSRILRLHEAALTLIDARFPNEAGIIVLSQFEACLDIVQAADDIKWAARWLEHKNTRDSATPNVTKTIEKLFKDDHDREIEISIFRNLSAMKHGNPASSELGFQVRERQGTITVSTGDLDDATTQEASDMVGAYATFQLARSAQILSVLTAHYAACEGMTKQEVHSNWQKIAPFGPIFARWIASFVEGRSGHLDIARLKSP